MTWQDSYKKKMTTAKAALSRLKPGSRVFVGTGCGEPQHLIQTMVGLESMGDTELTQVLSVGPTPYTEPRYRNAFRANAMFIGEHLREPVNLGHADYTPVHLSQVPDLFRSRRMGLDVALIQVSPPDSNGFCSLGVSVDITKSAAESARLVIAQVNKHMPRTLGEAFVHVDKVNFFVEHSEPLLTWGHDAFDDVTKRIASHIARLVPDGSTLQLGIGRIPDAVLHMLGEKNDLGIHTEMFSDGVMKLANDGVITGKYKTITPGKIVGSMIVGSSELFEWADNNPEVEMQPSDFTNSPRVISKFENFVAINSGLEIDLTGQLAADSLGTRFYSGLGGHADFMRGAAMAEGGKPIIALPSTAATEAGVRSRISASLLEGAGVITTRGDIHYVVTEFGVAYLHGRNVRERAMALIGIAHPDFRAELLHAAKARRMVYANQILPPPRAPYPVDLETRPTLKDGSEVLVRPVRPEDEPMMKDMFYSFSENTRYLRFHHTIKMMPHEQLQMFCNIDYKSELALVAVAGSTPDEQIIGIGAFNVDEGEQSAEMAFSVRDDWQRRGLGTYLFHRLLEIGEQRKIRRFEADVLSENVGMLKIFQEGDMKTDISIEAGVVHVTMIRRDPEAQST